MSAAALTKYACATAGQYYSKGGCMNIRKTLLVAGAVSTVGLTGAGLSHSGAVSAATDSSSDPSSSLVDKLVKKFNLNKTDVQAVFDAERTEREAARQAETETALTQAVKDGKLSEAQKAAILAKQKELQAAREADRDAMKDKTEAERKTAMETKRTELDTWATQNNIPDEYLRYVMGGGHGGPGGHGGGPRS
jgi:hypothetical protein